MKANECVRVPVRITSKEKPHVPMQFERSYLLFAIVTRWTKMIINMANFEFEFMHNGNFFNSVPIFDRLNQLNTQTLSQFI